MEQLLSPQESVADFHPLHDLVVLRKIGKEMHNLECGTVSAEETASGLLLPYREATRSTRGTIVKYGRKCRAEQTRPGTQVLFRDHEIMRPTMEFSDKDGDYVAFHEPDLLCSIERVTAVVVSSGELV